MFRKLFARIGQVEPTPPWSVGGAVSALIASFMAMLIGTTLALMIGGDGQFTPLLGWSLGAVVTIAFVLFTRRTDAQRAALRVDQLTDTASPQADRRSKAVVPAESVSRGALGPTGVGGGMSPLQLTLFLMLIGVGLAMALDVITGRATGLFLPVPELLRPYQDFVLYQLPPSLSTWILAVLFLVVLQPIAEELVFRGIVQSSLRESVGSWPGYLIAAGLSGAFHLMAYAAPPGDFAATWYGLVSPFLAALIFGAVRIYTGSTRAAIITHIAFGVFAVVKLLTVVA